MSRPPVPALTLLSMIVGLAAYTAYAGDVPPPPTPEEAALTRAEGAAKKLGATLKTRVQDELGKAGPVAALTVCNAEAGPLTSGVAGETGVTVGRSSLRLRNPDNAGPAWVRTWLEAQGERPAATATPYRAVVDGKARIIKPIAVEGACLTCHGAPATLAPTVVAELGRRYPRDQATGYAEGDLRGALWAEVPVK